MTCMRALTCSLLLFGVAALIGCGTDDANESRVALDAHRSLGAPLTVGNLTVWPVHTDKPLDIGEFLTLAEAQAKELAIVREVGGDGQVRNPSEAQRRNDASDNDGNGTTDATNGDAPTPQGGNGAPTPQGGNGIGEEQVRQVLGNRRGGGDAAVVNTLVIENKGELPILVCAGTIVDGGKQDRQIGQDFVIAAGTSVNVDAFCVEQGRWQAGEGAQALMFSSKVMIAPKGVRSSAQYDRDQGKVWQNVSKSLKSAGVESESQTLLAAKEKAKQADTDRQAALTKRILDWFASRAKGKDAPVGFAYAVNGKPVTVRTFAHARIFRGQLPAFVEAMAMDARSGEKAAKAGFAPLDAAGIVAFTKQVSAAQEELRETRASNMNGYKKTDLGFNANCYLEIPGGGQGPDAKPAKRVVVSEDWTAK